LQLFIAAQQGNLAVLCCRVRELDAHVNATQKNGVTPFVLEELKNVVWMRDSM
jgi:hypothetical protein